MTPDEYVPSEEDFRDAYRAGREVLALDFGEGGDERADAEFHAFLARVRQAAKAEALREAAHYFAGGLHCADMRTTPEETVRYLNRRATEYETGDPR